jgi:hypothetical protein
MASSQIESVHRVPSPDLIDLQTEGTTERILDHLGLVAAGASGCSCGPAQHFLLEIERRRLLRHDVHGHRRRARPSAFNARPESGLTVARAVAHARQTRIVERRAPRLENRWACKRPVGSNPTPAAHRPGST